MLLVNFLDANTVPVASDLVQYGGIGLAALMILVGAWERREERRANIERDKATNAALELAREIRRGTNKT